MSGLMTEAEIEAVLGKARDLLEVGTIDLDDESFMMWEIIGGLAKHVTRSQFDEVMTQALHEGHEAMIYVPQNEEDGDWNV